VPDSDADDAVKPAVFLGRRFEKRRDAQLIICSLDHLAAGDAVDLLSGRAPDDAAAAGRLAKASRAVEPPQRQLAGPHDRLVPSRYALALAFCATRQDLRNLLARLLDETTSLRKKAR
jgi:hypothetical protein